MASVSQSQLESIKLRVQIAERYRDRAVKSQYQRSWARYFGTDYANENYGVVDTTRRSVSSGRRLDASNRPMRVNYDYGIVETKLRSIGFQYPDLIVQPMTDDAQQFSDVTQTALKYYWSDEGCKVQPAVLDCLMDRIVAGMGVAMVSWEFQREVSGIVEVQVEGARPADAEAEDVALQTEKQTVWKTIKDQPIVTRIDPLNFFVDPECARDLNKALYCGYVEWRPLVELKKDSRYKHTRDLKGSAQSLRDYIGDDFQGKSDEDLPADIKRVKLVHYFSINDQLHVAFAPEEEVEGALLVERWWWEYEGYPFEVHAGARSPNDFWATPDSVFYEHPVREIEQARALQAQYLRCSVPKLTLTGQAASPQQRKQAQSMVPYTLIELEPGQTLAPVPLQQNQMEIAAVVQDARQDISAIAAIDQYALNAPPTKRMSTQEVQQVAQSGGPRQQWDRQEYEEFCSRIAGKMLALLMQFNTVPKRLPIYDDQRQVVAGWTTFDASQIRGQFKVHVHVGSTSAPNSAEVLQSIGYLIQGLAPFIQIMAPALQIGVDLRPVLVAAIKAIPGIRNVDQIISPLLGSMQQGLGAGLPGSGMAPAQQQVLQGMMPGQPPAANPMQEAELFSPEFLQALMAGAPGAMG